MVHILLDIHHTADFGKESITTRKENKNESNDS